MSLTEAIIGLTRTLPIRGKGRLFDSFTPSEGERRAEVAPGITMRLDLANGQQRQMYMGCFNLALQRVVKGLLPPGGVLVDIGANVGFFSLLGATVVGPSGRVFAVEPYPPNFSILQEHIALNHFTNVHAHPIAVSDQPGSLRLYAPPPDAHREFNVSIVNSPSAAAFDVPAKTLDQCLAEWGVSSIDLMKVDVEGAEAKVLGGGGQALKEGIVKNLACEINGGYLRALGSSQRELVEQIKSYGFQCARLHGGRAVPLERDPVLREDSDPDVLFVHRTAVGR